MLLSVQGVLQWAFLLASCLAAAILFSYIPIPCSKTAWIFQCPETTPAQDAESFGDSGHRWLTVPQAAAATVGLLLPRRRAQSRYFLAFLAVVSATAAHCMEARMILIFIAAGVNPGDIGLIIMCGAAVVVYLAGDLLGLISLLIRGPEY
ncbi:hypothetical protein EJB05_02207 [Eragrostis curvula]|uniref:Uncharacterized protein n=1 Tax=Eragrostis curvula TaxID=38414 RepID=A0A5J9WSE3_9POAL|nr:hypothetical protein EJB05_02207 [Eragrostis curvula]